MSKGCVEIPAHNEVENLPKLVGALEEELQKENFRIVIVDDNSPNGTTEIAKKLNELFRNIHLS